MITRTSKQRIPPPDGLVIATTTAAILTLLPVAAHQLGLLGRLPDPPGALFASDTITESKAAHPLGVADGLVGLGSYAATLGLVMLGRENPRCRWWLKQKLRVDGSVATINIVRQIVSFGRICSWCTGTALCTAGMLLAARNIVR